ncbi:hypothetical protein IJT10_02795 [bacterium]|nr:hypothetical protein [bacterium]
MSTYSKCVNAFAVLVLGICSLGLPAFAGTCPSCHGSTVDRFPTYCGSGTEYCSTCGSTGRTHIHKTCRLCGGSGSFTSGTEIMNERRTQGGYSSGSNYSGGYSSGGTYGSSSYSNSNTSNLYITPPPSPFYTPSTTPEEWRRAKEYYKNDPQMLYFMESNKRQLESSQRLLHYLDNRVDYFK